MGWYIALAVIALIGMIPLGVSVRYEEKLHLKIRIAFLRLTIPLKKKKPDKEKEKQEEKAPDPMEEKLKQQDQKLAAEEKAAKKQVKKKEKTDLKIYLPFVRLALDFLGSLRRKLRIEKLYLKAILAGADPCDLAVNYGKAWAAGSALMGNLNQIFKIKDQDLNIECDFTADSTVFSCRLDLTITLARLLSLAAGYGLRAIKEFLIFKKRKGGAIS